MHKFFLAVLSLALINSSCNDEGSDPDSLAIEEVKEKIIELSTIHGKMHIWLYKGTPLHRDNFIKLSDEGFFDGTEFHRLVNNFVIQGGDPNSKNDDRTDDGKGGPGYTIPAEIDFPKHRHFYGALAAARTPDGVNPERASSGSQFYICMDSANTAQLDGAYTVFGEVIDGMATAEGIAAEPHNSTTGLPVNRIPMQVSVIEMTASDLMSRFNFTIPEE